MNHSDGTILVMQGGGAYGAYECGVYQYLASRLDDLAIVAGTSAGAINAAVIASHYESADHGAAALERLWRDDLATRSIPFFAALRTFVPDSHHWDAVWTSLLRGNPAMFTPRVFLWPLMPPAAWPDGSFYASDAMRRTLEKYVAVGKSGQPRLIVTAVDVERGTPRVFDSAREPIGASEVTASGSLPPWMPGTAIGGRVLWDGGLWSNTPLSDVFDALQRDERPSARWHVLDRPRRYSAILVNVWPRRGSMPSTLWQTQERINELVYADKTDYDRSGSERVNRYLEFVYEVDQLMRAAPESSETRLLRQRIAEEYRRCANEALISADITVIQRRRLPDDDISHEIDFSPERIDRLIEQGRDDAARALRA